MESTCYATLTGPCPAGHALSCVCRLPFPPSSSPSLPLLSRPVSFILFISYSNLRDLRRQLMIMMSKLSLHIELIIHDRVQSLSTLSLSFSHSACTFNQLKGHASLAHCAVCASIKQSPECGRRGSGCNNSHISSLSCMLKTINYYLQKVNFYLETNKQRVRARSTQQQRRRHQVWQQHTYT